MEAFVSNNHSEQIDECIYLVLLDACKGVLPIARASSAATDSKKSFLTLRDVADSGLFRLASD